MIRLLAEVVRRRGEGEELCDGQIIGEHPELMPQLLEELEGLRMLQRAFAAGQRAGAIQAPLVPVSLEEIDQPILPAIEPERADSGRLSIPGYQIFREITTGGQATVYKALQGATGRIVAIKVLPGGTLAGSRDRNRFDREAEILASLDHPNIVAIIDRGCTSDGSFYFVMPYITGIPLDEFANTCRSETVDVTRTRLLKVFGKLARTVGLAHARGIIHRDLKPSNILVDAEGEPHLLDFGLARLLKEPEMNWRARTITVAGQVVGSLPWLSPEQVSGKSNEFDTRSDIYALGVCFYQCLTGHHPYSLDGAIPDVIDRIRFAPPPPITRSTGWDTESVQFILNKCLAKAPADRYATAEMLVRDIDSLLYGISVGPSIWHLRRRRLLQLGRCACILGLLAFGYCIWLRQGAPQHSVTVFQLPTTQTVSGISLVRIPRGRLLMGTTNNAAIRGDDEGLHEVEFSHSFWVSTKEITRAQYFAVMDEEFKESREQGELPITEVSWEDAAAFCRSLSQREQLPYRLPTEAEWEYACRAGSSETWAGTGVPDEMGWTAENSGGELHHSAECQRNHWGLYDMHGNAAEWCLDWYNPVYPITRIDPLFRDRTGLRVIRGGSYRQANLQSRSAARDSLSPHLTRPDVGFRIVREDIAATRPALSAD